MDQRRVQRFSVEKFLSHSTENVRGETLLCFRNFLVPKKIMEKKGVSRFCVGFFLSQIAEKHRGRTLLFFRNVLTANFFWIIGVSQPCRFFCLTSPKIVVGEPFCVSEIFWNQNVLDNRGITIMSNVQSHKTENFVGERFRLSEKFQ